MNSFEKFFDFDSNGRLDAIERSSLYDEIERIEAEADTIRPTPTDASGIDDLDDTDLDTDAFDDDFDDVDDEF